jgi:transposase
MAILRLAYRAWKVLQQIARSGDKAREVRRAQALLWLNQGESVQKVAQRLGINRRTVYHWIEQYSFRRAEPVRERLKDRSHTGRPPKKREVAVKVLQRLLPKDPRRYGYRSMVWTVPRLCQEVWKKTGVEVSQRTVRRTLRRVRYRYKRPRYVLARRSPYWRQSKGGSNGA